MYQHVLDVVNVLSMQMIWKLMNGYLCAMVLSECIYLLFRFFIGADLME